MSSLSRSRSRRLDPAGEKGTKSGKRGEKNRGEEKEGKWTNFEFHRVYNPSGSRS